MATRFQGKIKIGYIQGGLKDLDQNPPLSVDRDGHGDLWFTTAGGNTLFAVDRARMAKVESPSSLPGYEECRLHTAASGEEELTIRPGDVLCVRTSEGRTALLVVTVLIEPAKTGNLPTCDVTVWEPVTYE